MGKHRRLRKLFAAVLCICMMCPVVSPLAGEGSSTVQAAQAGMPKLLASYPLLADIKDVSGNGYHGKAVGELRYYNGLTFPGNEDSSTNYAELPQGMLDGKDTLTVSVWRSEEHTSELQSPS